MCFRIIILHCPKYLGFRFQLWAYILGDFENTVIKVHFIPVMNIHKLWSHAFAMHRKLWNEVKIQVLLDHFCASFTGIKITICIELKTFSCTFIHKTKKVEGCTVITTSKMCLWVPVLNWFKFFCFFLEFSSK